MLKKNSIPQHVGLAWYKPEQWQRLREVASDVKDIEERYEDWQLIAEEKLAELRMLGIQVQKVEVDINELVAWCAIHGLLVNAESRAKFVAKKLEQKKPPTK